MRLINADDMIKSLMDMNFYDAEGHTIHDYEDRLAIVKSFVDSVPTVEAQLVRHGKWIIRRECVDGTFFTGCRCSECNYWKPMDIWKYCPNCGAKMGDEHGTD